MTKKQKVAAVAAKGASAAIVAATGVVNPVAGVGAAIAQPIVEELFASFVGRKRRRLEAFASGDEGWVEAVRQIGPTCEGEALLDALMDDAEDEKLWAYKAVAAAIADGGHDHDRALRYIATTRALRQKQILRLIWVSCSAPTGAYNPEAKYGYVDEGTLTELIRGDLYWADVSAPYCDSRLSTDGQMFVNLLLPAAPIVWDWPCEPLEIEDRLKPLPMSVERRIKQALKERDRKDQQRLRFPTSARGR